MNVINLFPDDLSSKVHATKATADLIGRELDYFTALALGWKWARNMANRSGDGFNSKTVKWPIGARCVVRPNACKDLHPTKKNWDGWCVAEETDPIAPNAMFDVPHFSSSWANLSGFGMGQIIGDIGLGFMVNHNSGCPPSIKVTAFHPKLSFGYQGPDHLVAACRAIVAATFGPVVAIQKE